MAYELAPLPYDYAALEPFIDAETMHLHHDKHHQAYINNVNAALANHPELASKSADDLIRDLNAIPEDIRGVVRNNGGGNSNHTAFWNMMGPAGSTGIGGAPTGAIASQITKDFGDFDALKKTFNETAAKQFGSGWGWLVFQAGKLKGHHHRQPGLAAQPGPLPDSRQRCLGTRLLPQVPESPPRLPCRLVECSQLGRSQQALRHRPEIKDSGQ